MAQTVKLKRSNTAGTIPTTSNLELGEVAINTKDGKFYLRKHVDGSSADQILAFAPQGVNAFGTQIFTVKVAGKTSAHPNHGSGSSNGYVINGLESPYLALIPGNTYRFDNSDSTNSGHPFRFYLEANKTTAYTTGVTVNGSAGNSGAYVEIAVTASTPSQLYYQCSAHSLMGSAAYTIAGASSVIADNSVTAAKIAVNAVGSSEIAQNSVTSVQIPNNSIGSTQISAAYTSGLTVADNGITSAKIASNSILTRHIDDNQIGIDQLNVSDGSANQVLTTDGSGTLSFADPSAGTVTQAFKTISVSGQSDVVADAATDTLTLAGSGGMTITTTAGTDTITFSSSTTPADDSVTTAKIADLNVTAAKLAVNAVTTAKVADNAIDSTKIAQNSILTKHIDDNQIGIDQLNVSDGTSGQALVTDGSGTLSFSTISSGGGSQNLFDKVAVAGQSNVAADSTTDTLTFVAGNNMTITTSAANDSVTFASTASGSGAAYSFANMNLNEFSGDGSTTAFTLGQTPGNEDNLIVFVDGVYQNKDAFSISGTSLTFGTAPANGRKIIAYVTADAPTIALGSTTFTDQFTTSNASTTAFTLSKTVPSEDNLMVFVDAAFQSHDDLSLSGTTLTLATAPPSGAVVTVHGFSGAAIGNSPTLDTYTGDGSTTAFTLSINPGSENNTNVFVNGVYQNKSTYSVSGTTLTFSSAPANSAAIEVHMLTIQSLGEGSIVAGSLAAGSVTSSAIAGNAVGSTQIAASGVTAASYGSSTAIPVITIDADGRITSASTATTSTSLTLAADSGSSDTVTVGTDTLTFAGTSNEIETSVSNNQIQVGLVDNPTVGGNLTVTGNLIVNGSTTTVSTANMTVEDNLIELNTGATSNANDAGIVIERGSTGDNAIFAWDESADKFIVGTTTATGASTGNLTITAAPLVTGALTSSSATIASLAYPTSDGTDGQALITNGAGTLSFSNISIDGAIMNTYSSTGNGSATAFDTSIAIADEKNTWVFVDGVYQPKDTYSTSGTTVTFSAAPPNGADVEVLIGKVAGFDSADTVLGKYSTTTSGTGYSTGITFTNENNTFLFIDGIYQPKDTYSVSGSTLTLDADPVDGLDLELIATKTLNASAVETAMLANNAVSAAKIASNAVGTTEIATDAVGGAELAPAALSTQTMTGAKSFSGNLTVDTNTLHVDSANDRVGIGTASPAYKLHVIPSDNDGIIIDSSSDSHTGFLYFGDATSNTVGAVSYDHFSDAMRFKVNDAERMRITSSAIGIGTSSPTSYANSQKTLVIEDSTSPAIAWSDTGQTRDWFAIAQGSGLHFNYGDGGGSGSASNVTSALVLDNSGKVGIGTDSPDGQLHIKGSTNKTLKLDTTFSSGSYTTLAFARNGTDKWRVFQTSNDDYLAFYNDQVSATQFSLNANGSATFTNTAGTNAPDFVTIEGDTSDNNNYPAIYMKGGTLANNYPSYGITNGGLGTWIQAGYHTSNYNNRAAISVNNGTVGMYTSASSSYVQTFNLTTGGNLQIAGSITPNVSFSDLRLKENIVVISDAVEKVKSLQGITFTRKKDGGEGTGLIAQELEKVLPQAVYEEETLDENDDTKYKAINYGTTVGLLVEAIKEQQTIIDDLKSRIETLEG